jgi:hypothetical protein
MRLLPARLVPRKKVFAKVCEKIVDSVRSQLMIGAGPVRRSPRRRTAERADGRKVLQ